jgi:glycerol-3-phosphate acyltransferase PlsY
VTGRWALLLGGAYLLGSISFSLLLVRLLAHIDLRSFGSGNAGATNVLRASGRWPALLVLLLDVAKGFVPVRLGQGLGAPAAVAAGAGAAAIVGHAYPAFFGFRGGRGVATGFGVFLALSPLAGVAALAVFLALVAATRIVSVGSVVGAALAPAFTLLFARLAWGPAISAGALALATAGSAVVVWRHRDNLARLRAGTERRLGERRAPS